MFYIPVIDLGQEAFTMEINLFQRIQRGLLEKRQNIDGWLETTSPAEVEIQTACCEGDPVGSQLATIDHTLKHIEAGTLGVCDVCHEQVDSALLEMDFTSCVCIDHYSDKEKRQLEAELEFSGLVQRALMPQQAPPPADVDLAAFSRPAQIVNGDTFDFYKFRNGSEGFAIADAVGHGVSAGLLMSSLQTALRLLAPENDSPARVLERINRLFLHNANFTTFVTVFLASFDPARRRLRYSNAGHNPPLFYQSQRGAVTHLMPTGAALGLMDRFNTTMQTLKLSPGDILLLYTDGVTEARDGQKEEFGLERLEALVQRNAALSSAELVRVIRQEHEAYLHGEAPEDDTTLVAIKFR
jgi:sigma-B regulation protein RsbU (phosphoserine phosphatase)